MGAITIIFVFIGILCGVSLSLGFCLNRLVKSNTMGDEDEKTINYMDYKTLSYHAIYDDKLGMNHFDGNYK
jgi:hypothetical protein